jgi:CDP-diacylglycerol--glycerol-3-phosphate 3-phosphatidyltransferase
VLIMLTDLNWLPAWIAIVIISREIIVTGLRAIAADQGKVIAADMLGKSKTLTQMFALGPLILHYPWFGFDPVPLGTVILYVALALTILSGANYLRNFYKVWME